MKQMRNRMDRLVLLPFSVGCVSESSVAVGVFKPRRSKPDPDSSPIRAKKEVDQEEEEGSLSDESIRSSYRFLAIPKNNISTGFHRLFKGFKNISQIFVYKEEMEEMETDMEIGSPTDVKHVTHIGWDTASANDNPIMGFDHNLLVDPHQLLSAPSISFCNQVDNQELSLMASQAASSVPLVNGST